MSRVACRSDVRTRAGLRQAVLGAWLAAIILLEAGCVVTPRQPAAPSTPPAPQVPENAAGNPPVTQEPTPTAATEFHAEPTDQQRFHVHLDFGRVFESQGNPDRAVLEYQEALSVVEGARRGPFRPADEALAHRRMAGALDRMGRFAQAEVHYKKALKLTPKDPKVWNDAGYSYYLQGRFRDAETALKTAAKLAPDNERIKLNLGLALAADGRAKEALPLLSLSNGDAVGHANLGYLLASTGQYDLARHQYEQALALRPDLELAKRAITRLDRQAHEESSGAKPREQLAKAVNAPGQSLDQNVRPAATSRETTRSSRRPSVSPPDHGGGIPAPRQATASPAASAAHDAAPAPPLPAP